MIYRMSGKENQVHIEVTAVREPYRLKFLHHITKESVEQVFEESYEIIPQGNRSKVVQSIDLSRAGIPWLFRLLIGFIDRLGRKVDEQPLDLLKQLAEQSSITR